MNSVLDDIRRRFPVGVLGPDAPLHSVNDWDVPNPMGIGLSPLWSLPHATLTWGSARGGGRKQLYPANLTVDPDGVWGDEAKTKRHWFIHFTTDDQETIKLLCSANADRLWRLDRAEIEPQWARCPNPPVFKLINLYGIHVDAMVWPEELYDEMWQCTLKAGGFMAFDREGKAIPGGSP